MKTIIIKKKKTEISKRFSIPGYFIRSKKHMSHYDNIIKKLK